MKLQQLNQCLAEMDTLQDCSINHESPAIVLTFACHGGGRYENVTVKVNFNEPLRFHLPYFAQGQFSIRQISQQERIHWISIADIESEPTVFQLIVNAEHSSDKDDYYICCHQLSWSVEGTGSKNKHELDVDWG